MPKPISSKCFMERNEGCGFQFEHSPGDLCRRHLENLEAHRRHANQERSHEAVGRLRLLGHNLSALPDVDRRSIYPCCFPRLSRGGAEGSCDRLGKLLTFFVPVVLVHGPSSISSGRSPELSYTHHQSASGLYRCLPDGRVPSGRGVPPLSRPIPDATVTNRRRSSPRSQNE